MVLFLCACAASLAWHDVLDFFDISGPEILGAHEGKSTEKVPNFQMFSDFCAITNVKLKHLTDVDVSEKSTTLLNGIKSVYA